MAPLRTTVAVLLLLTGCDASPLQQPTQARTTSDGESVVPDLEPGTPEADLPVAPALTFANEVVEARARTVVEELAESRFSQKVHLAEYATAFLHLAHTHEDPVIVSAALRMIRLAYRSRPHLTYPTVDEDYNAVVAYRLDSREPRVLAAALEAARLSMESHPSPASIGAPLVAIANEHPHPAARIAALQALARTRPMTADVEDAFTRAFSDANPDAVALALDVGQHMVRHASNQDTLAAELEALTESRHAGVRGAALAAFSKLKQANAAHEDRVIELASAMLDDASPYVRAKAVYVLGWTRNVDVAEHLLRVLDDAHAADATIYDWTELDGSPGTRTLVATGGRSVQEVALLSLGILSTATDERFSHTEHVIRSDAPGGDDYGPAVIKAKAWIHAHQGA